HCIGPAQPAASYLDHARILEAAKASGAQAIHPGYGFLSENAGFAEACEQAGLAFIGPTPAQMRAFGLKHKARELAVLHGVPLTPGSHLLADAAEALSEAARIGYPVMLKSTAGGGGIGMRLCRDAGELATAWDSVTRLAAANFKDAGAYVERYVERGRHVEVQVAGDGTGAVIAVGDRDCSAQRRHQKVIEEAPAPGLSDAVRRELHACAVRLCASVNYRSVGTVEFLYDEVRQAFYFLEVNTRLQVEHGVTEEVAGIDLVEWMIRISRGEVLASVAGDLNSWPRDPSGCAMQARVYAENALLDFRPATGTLSRADFPAAGLARVETWVARGTEVTPHYDPMLAKVIARGTDREAARTALLRALEVIHLEGVVTNVGYLRAVAASNEFAHGAVDTAFLGRFTYAPRALEVIEAGPHATVQDWPGRVGYWEVGVPPSGPMDAFSFRLANALLGNAADAAGIEFTLSGPTIRFHADTVACLAGGDLPATLDGKTVERWKPFAARGGQTLKVAACRGAGLRGYLCVRGGIGATPYLGSRATFDLGRFGGPYGRTLAPGDILMIGEAGAIRELPLQGAPGPIPAMSREWDIGVLYGPHGAPDFFAEEDIETLFSASYTVHHNSSRTGVRLVGPKPAWARKDGGEAGLHPSNIHDNAYAVGAIDFTGDMPILLGPDGPSLGGFVCPAVTAQAELWKLGQLRPGDSVRFVRWDAARAAAALEEQEAVVAAVAGGAPLGKGGPWVAQAAAVSAPAVLHRFDATAYHPGLCLRRQGDASLLVEYGALELDLKLRARVQALYEALNARRPPGLLDLTPGIRSLQIHFDPRRTSIMRIADAVIALDAELPSADAMRFTSRTVHLPLSWDDEAIHRVIERYATTVRPDAPWCPSNIEFIRRINGLSSIEDVKRIVFDARWLVLGLGDVYLGAPVATPLDPRHRLVTTKYNPARTWTVENVVGIGGAYMCVYGMEGPGGYQLFGRTCQVWNTHRVTREFEAEKPWLLRFFDQIRFYPVSHEELTDFRADFLSGRASLKIEENAFDLGDYARFLDTNAESIAAFRTTQRAAFAEERARWAAAGFDATPVAEESAPEDAAIPEGCEGVSAPLTGNLLRIEVSEGDRVEAGQAIAVLESMKMEFPAVAPSSGTVRAIRCKPGATAQAGQTLAIVEIAT
ncbi:MAG TPA: urea carboxylase, partial [Fibrobacteria bacterium]|nr:urea carboxylase [Fibrobacteria bacterium]